MSLDIKLLTEESSQAKILFDYVVSKNYTEITSDMLKFEIITFFETNYVDKKQSELKKLSKELSFFNFYDQNNYSNFQITETVLKQLVVLSHFKHDLIQMLDSSLKPIDFGVLKRQISPPLEVYKPIYHTKVDITPSGRSYGLLFE